MASHTNLVNKIISKLQAIKKFQATLQKSSIFISLDSPSAAARSLSCWAKRKPYEASKPF